MLLKRLLTIFTAVSAITLINGYAVGQSAVDTRIWVGDVDSDFNDANNWSGDTMPDSNDIAKIGEPPASNPDPETTGDATIGKLWIVKDGFLTVSGDTLTIATASGLDIDDATGGTARGTLIVSGGGTVKLTGGGTGHRVDGILDLGVGSASAGTLSIDTSDVTITGGTVGVIFGKYVNSMIVITEDETFTSDVLIRGLMTIKPASGSATFCNLNDVIANADGNLVLDTNLTLSDDSTANWKAITSVGATLQFKEAVSDLAGAFECDSNGVLDFDATVTTTGCLTQPNGVDCVDASASGVCFNWCDGGNDCNGTS